MAFSDLEWQEPKSTPPQPSIKVPKVAPAPKPKTITFEPDGPGGNELEPAERMLDEQQHVRGKFHKGGRVEKTGPYQLLEGERIVPAPKANKNKMKTDSTEDVRLPDNTGVVRSGADDNGREMAQPDPDTETGAGQPRVRKEIAAGGHHVSGGDDPNGANRQAFIESERKRNELKVRGDSSRKTMRETLVKK